MPFIKLNLVGMPETVVGIYKGKLPQRMRFLHPSAGESYLLMDVGEERMIVSDMLRSADSSKAAVEAGRGAQMPSYSGHNFGFSIDIDVDAMLQQKRFAKSKKALDEWMTSQGWHCFRKDHVLASECWHYNYYGDRAPMLLNAAEKTNEKSLERLIVAIYAKGFALIDKEVQDALQRLGFYSGEIDGDVGPLSRSAILAFQKAWGLTDYWRSGTESGSFGVVTKRVLSFVEADAVRRGAIKDSTLFQRA